MYPSPSNWNSPDADSAWIVRAGTTAQQSSVCQTNGWNFLVDLQTELRSRLQAAPSPTWDGTTVDGSYIPINDGVTNSGWDYPLLQGLYALAAVDGAPQDALQSIQSDAGTQSISARTLATAIWVAEYGQGMTQTGQVVYGQGSVNEISIPAGTALPQFGVVPPMSTAGTVIGLDCHTVSGLPVSAQGNPVSSVAVIGIVLAGLIAIVSLTSNLPKAPRERRTAYRTTQKTRRVSR